MDNTNQLLDFSEYEQRKLEHSQPVDLKRNSWVLVYCNKDFDAANMLYEGLTKVAAQFGIKIDEPQYIECPNDAKADDYLLPIQADVDMTYIEFAVVLYSKRPLKAPVKKHLDKMGLKSQFVQTSTVLKEKNLPMMATIIKQINAKMGLDLYRVSLPAFKKTMIIGTSLRMQAGKALMGLSASCQ